MLDEKFNSYSYQTYQIWLLIAKHKHKSEDLIKFAVDNIERNDETNRTVIGAMIIYVCSVDEDYKRVILRKFGQGFTNRYFQNRIALIALRSFNTNLIPTNNIVESLSTAPEFTNKYKNKDLVYIYGSEEDNEETEDFDFEQLYSL
ncbi:hypothetical protein [Niastella sp. OAS944]|uniref:hypothetical protein n=1 Tax=Niastella sp. OAS944 TaxID=2664089 RepID=UPI003470D0B2|nr:hypothetical protein [Chitinophagaceae bacterium OAS944]